MAPVAIGSVAVTGWVDRLLTRASPVPRALMAKEIRTVTRDVAQWSQVFLMAALLFIYLYNIRMLPLEGFEPVTFGMLWQGRRSALIDALIKTVEAAARELANAQSPSAWIQK